MYSELNSMRLYITEQLRLQLYSGWNRVHLYSSLTAPSEVCATLTRNVKQFYNCLGQTKCNQNFSHLVQAKRVHIENAVTLTILIVSKKEDFSACPKPVIETSKPNLNCEV